METTEQIRKVKAVKSALLSMQRHSWEQGVAAHAFLDLGEKDMVTALAMSAVMRQTEDGRAAVMGSDQTVTDPCAPGEAIAEAWRLTGDPIFEDALNRLLDWALCRAPRTSCGVVCHLIGTRQVWADSCYMLPTFLAAAGHAQEAVEQMEGYHRLLCDPQSGLFHHIWDAETGRFVRADFWGGGNGWAAASMARLLHRIPAQEEELHLYAVWERSAEYCEIALIGENTENIGTYYGRRGTALTKSAEEKLLAVFSAYYGTLGLIAEGLETSDGKKFGAGDVLETDMQIFARLSIPKEGKKNE